MSTHPPSPAASSPHRSRPTWRHALAGLALAATTAAGLAACSGEEASTMSEEASGSSGGDTALTESRVPRESRAQDGIEGPLTYNSERSAGDEAGTANTSEDAAADVVAAAGADEKVVSHGTVSLESDDVAAARAEVQRVADTVGGQVSESDTETGDDGDVVRSRVVLRVPVKEFDDAIDALEQLGDLRSSDQRSDVVTEQYADLTARVRAQEASLRRVELLFRRAQTIQDVVAVESQLTSRQAELDSLKGQLRVLDDRASMSTIAVHLARTPDPEKKQAEPDDEQAGFVAGLSAGWSALSAAAVTTATVLGALLPFLVLLVLVGGPVLWLTRRRVGGRRTTS